MLKDTIQILLMALRSTFIRGQEKKEIRKLIKNLQAAEAN